MKLETDNLSVIYGRHRAVQNITMTAYAGEILVIAGPNGSGKSSLLKAIAGVVRSEGQCFFDGAGQRPARIGYMPQDNAARTALTVLETILLGRIGRLGLRVSDHDLQAADALLRQLNLQSLAERSLGALSGGQRQLVFLAQAMAAESPLLLLDEPLSALDLCHQLTVMETVKSLTRARRLTTIAVLHDLPMAARYADRIAVIQAGTLAAIGTPKETLTEARIAQVFGVQTRIAPSDISGLLIEPLRPVSVTPPAAHA